MVTLSLKDIRALLSNRALYVAPANPAGKKLAAALASQGYKITGFADNFKQRDDIINAKSDADENACVILHHAPYTDDIAAGLLKRGFAKTDLVVARTTETNKLSIKPYKLPFSFILRNSLFSALSMLFALLRVALPQRGYVYYAEGFFDTNMLLAYREHQRQFPKEAVLLGRHLKQKIASLDSDPHKYEGVTLTTLWLCLRAEKIIVDHEFTGKWFTLMRKHIPVIQLWHGLPYKALSGNMHYPTICDDAFISSSPWFNEHIFPKIFRAKQYLALGYPRNDVFAQHPQERDWINAEPHAALLEVQEKTGKIIIYAPTYRDWGNNEYPLDLAKLEAWCKSNKRSFILKFHPFISRVFGEAMGLPQSDSLQQLPDHSHLYLYPSGKNIYPWLADAAALVTDYSSIAYDFLLADKPIVYFQYDKEEYVKLRGETLVSDNDFLAGNCALTINELLNMLLFDSEACREKRTALRDKFGMTNKHASPSIVNLLRNNNATERTRSGID